MRIDVLTIFPELIESASAYGMPRVARERGVLEVRAVNLRDFTDDTHRTTDDKPFGGGAGMVLLAEPIARAIEHVAPGRTPPRRAAEAGTAAEAVAEAPSRPWVIVLTPQGKPFQQADAQRLSAREHLVLVCGRYKGVDERVAAHLADEELSVGDFVLSGGEPAALCVLDAVARLLPGVLGDFDSAESDSFHSSLLDCAYFTRPADFRGFRVPEVLLSGDHGRIARYRRQDALRRTWERRPDLLERAELTEEERRLVAAWERERLLSREEGRS
jgi:tRNA (guanine37-N1)-methyltransferase